MINSLKNRCIALKLHHHGKWRLGIISWDCFSALLNPVFVISLFSLY